jgi:DNA-binding transcriptional ArsR family regulator
VTVRFAPFNVENLFARPPAFNQATWAEGELSAGELTRRLVQPQPRVSNHLACLRGCEFVTTRCDHRIIYYRLADDRVAAMLGLAHDCSPTTLITSPPAAASWGA